MFQGHDLNRRLIQMMKQCPASDLFILGFIFTLSLLHMG